MINTETQDNQNSNITFDKIEKLESEIQQKLEHYEENETYVLPRVPKNLKNKRINDILDFQGKLYVTSMHGLGELIELSLIPLPKLMLDNLADISIFCQGAWHQSIADYLNNCKNENWPEEWKEIHWGVCPEDTQEANALDICAKTKNGRGMIIHPTYNSTNYVDSSISLFQLYDDFETNDYTIHSTGESLRKMFDRLGEFYGAIII